MPFLVLVLHIGKITFENTKHSIIEVGQNVCP